MDKVDLGKHVQRAQLTLEMGIWVSYPRATNYIFDTVKEMENWDIGIMVSFMEQLYDLLASNICTVDIREEGKGIRIPGLTEIQVSSVDDTTVSNAGIILQSNWSSSNEHALQSLSQSLYINRAKKMRTYP